MTPEQREQVRAATMRQHWRGWHFKGGFRWGESSRPRNLGYGLGIISRHEWWAQLIEEPKGRTEPLKIQWTAMKGPDSWEHAEPLLIISEYIPRRNGLERRGAAAHLKSLFEGE
jgi:hypothetical protein